MSETNLTIASLIAKDVNFSGTELVELGIALVTQLFCVLLIIILFRTYPFHVHLWILMMVRFSPLLKFVTVFPLCRGSHGESLHRKAPSFLIPYFVVL